MSRILTLGEIMLRLSTRVDTRLSESKQFQVHYGGGEANVAISLANYNHSVSFASKVPNNALGLAVKRHLQQYGVSTDLLLFGGTRLGSYYLESGVGERSSSVIYDRAYSSFSEIEMLEWSMDELFGDVELFHVSGITPALSDNWAKLTEQLMKEAKKRSVKISFDINYRAKLWSYIKAKSILPALLPYADYCSAGKLDAIHLLGIEEQSKDGEDVANYYQQMSDLYPNIEMFYSTLREIKSTSDHILKGTIWNKGVLYASKKHFIVPVIDRVGGGDAFSAGIIHGLLTKQDLDYTVSFATAASAMKHTITGDCNQFSIEEIEEFMTRDDQRIKR
ncbi:2-dehydro-3-deoxygluconokinase [Bacillus sp. NRRL B-14911]|uniref:2-dehydro-3-deoxygluconokinase n=1 Tax=Bacillus infantis NRRL B-14911 TaxID=1367477 RepID=U5LJK0_9BACI|nr:MULTISPECIES: sugar kinase [Bacillus]AGX06807.1 2-dehydro-3-deoxygluconokinase [Bacillus infantis NRRL B-14911]EAR67724.1 2-dehydro-3-deoxygluconokinase [Bacillus sp. NRRL B-14911]